MLPQCFFRDRCDWHAFLVDETKETGPGKLEIASLILGLLVVICYLMRGVSSLKRWYARWKNTQPIEEQGERIEYLKRQEKAYSWSKKVQKALREERRAAIATYNELLLDRAKTDQLRMEEEGE